MRLSPRIDGSRRRWLAALPLLAIDPLLLRPALASPALPRQVQRASRLLMGTQVDIVVQGPEAATAQTAIEAAFAEMGRLEQMMSRFRPDSLVGAMQRQAGRSPMEIPDELLAVLQMARKASEFSAGAFDITVGAYAGWKFGDQGSGLPSDAELTRERKLVDYRDLLLDANKKQAYLRRQGMKIDLGGVAKLPILAAGLRVLRGFGLHDALLNGGGDVLASGQLQGRDWRVGIRDPRAPARLLGVVELRDGFVAASGDYERCFERGGRRYHHILDPKTGWPSRGPHGVALVSRQLEAINGLGAAIMVAGLDAGRRMLAARPEVDALIVDADARPWLSDGMARRMLRA